MNKYVLTSILLMSCSGAKPLNITIEKFNTNSLKMIRTYYSNDNQIFIEDDGYNIIDIEDIGNGTTYNIYFKFIKYIDINEKEFTIGYAEFGNYPELINVHSFTLFYYDSILLEHINIAIVYQIPDGTYFNGTLIEYINYIQQYPIFQDLTEDKDNFINDFIDLFQPVLNIDWQYNYQF